jgi:hypothetical protein
MIGTIIGTLMDERTRRALARINWLGSCGERERREREERDERERGKEKREGGRIGRRKLLE